MLGFLVAITVPAELADRAGVFVHPSAEAVAAMTAAYDPAARRRQY